MIPRFEQVLDSVRRNRKLIIAEDYEIALQQVETRVETSVNGEIKGVSLDSSLWVSLRVFHRKRAVRVVTTSDNPVGLQNLVESAFNAADLSSPDPYFRFPSWRKLMGSPATIRHTLQTALGAFGSRVHDVEERRVKHGIETQIHRKSQKPDQFDSREVGTISLQCAQQYSDGHIRLKESRPLGADLAKIEARIKAFEQMKSANLQNIAGDGDWIFSPPAFAKLLQTIAPWFRGDFAQGLGSPLSGQLGQAIASTNFSLCDSATVDGAMVTFPFDIEGSPTQSTTLISGGRLESWLYDTRSGLKDNHLSTGNLFRPVGSLIPEIGVSNFYAKPSSDDTESLVSEVKRGAYLAGLESVEIQADHETKLKLRGWGWQMEKGRPTYPAIFVGECDVLNLLKGIRAVGNDLEFSGAFGSPTVLVSRMHAC